MAKCFKTRRDSNVTLTGTATENNVLSDKTFYNTNARTKVTGTMANNGAVRASVGVGGSYTIPAGYHNGSGKVSGPTLNGTATASDVVSGKTFYSNSGTKQTGTLDLSSYIYIGGVAYQFKTGNTGTQSTYGIYRYCEVPSNIIPITLYVQLSLGRPKNSNNTAEVVDNNGTKYFDGSFTAGGSGNAMWFTSYAYISCIQNKSFDYAKTITKFTAQSRNGVSNLYIMAWLEPVS